MLQFLFYLIWHNRHNPYFNRWFSAIQGNKKIRPVRYCHNPYFNRWFSAIDDKNKGEDIMSESQSLF